MGRRTLNRKDLRADFEAAERRKTDDEEVEAEDEEETDEAEDEEEAETDEEAGEGAGEGDEDEEEEEAPKKKKPVKAAKPKSKAKPRSRAAKVTRMKVVWGVFSNSNQLVAKFEYPRRKEADDKAAQLTADKKNTHFVQPIKEPIEEKKEE